MKNFIVVFLCVPFISMSQNNSNADYVFSKMDVHDVYIFQNEIYSNLKDSIIEINKAPFKILFKSENHKKTDHALYISFFKEKININNFKIGTQITDHCIFFSSNRLAQGPFANYLGISGNSGCYKEEDERLEFCCIAGIGHHFFYYTDETYRNMTLLESNDDILNLEYLVSYFFDDGKNINMTSLDLIYILALQDFNLNNIIDLGELSFSKLKLTD